ncbi:MAG: glycosyltransferase, partial [Pirellulales bacterium]
MRHRNSSTVNKVVQVAETQIDQGNPQPTVTVILPCRNEESWILKTLESIIAGNYDTKLLEIIVIDGMSTDNTRNLIAQF